jgi:hypothetical protein
MDRHHQGAGPFRAIWNITSGVALCATLQATPWIYGQGLLIGNRTRLCWICTSNWVDRFPCWQRLGPFQIRTNRGNHHESVMRKPSVPGSWSSELRQPGTNALSRDYHETVRISKHSDCVTVPDLVAWNGPRHDLGVLNPDEQREHATRLPSCRTMIELRLLIPVDLVALNGRLGARNSF